MSDEVKSTVPASAPVQTEQAPIQTEQKPADDFSTRFAALARKEKMQQEKEAKIKEEANKYSKYVDLETKAKENPLSLLEAYGLDLDNIILASLGQQKQAPSVEEQLAQLKADLQKEKDDAILNEKKKKEEEEKAYQARIDEAILSHQNQIIEHLSKNADKYELIHLHDVHNLVWDTTESYYNEHNVVLSPEQAADMVEDYLYNQTLKAQQTKKFQQKLDKPVNEAPKGLFTETKVNPVLKQEAKTLTSELSDTAPNKTSTERVSAEESKRRAAEFLRQAWAKNK